MEMEDDLFLIQRIAAMDDPFLEEDLHLVIPSAVEVDAYDAVCVMQTE